MRHYRHTHYGTPATFGVLAGRLHDEGRRSQLPWARLQNVSTTQVDSGELRITGVNSLGGRKGQGFKRFNQNPCALNN
jgi:hypothetical protein